MRDGGGGRGKQVCRTEINQRNEFRICAAPVVQEEGEYGPCQGQYRDNEQDQDVVGGQDIIVDISVDKVGQHAHNGDESDNLEESPKDETDCEEHLDGGEVCMSMWTLCDVDREAIYGRSRSCRSCSTRLARRKWKHAAGSNDNHRVEIACLVAG